MSTYNYSDFERQLNMVLAHQSAELSEIHFPSTESADACIASSEALLRKLGYKIEKPNLQVAPSNRVAVLTNAELTWSKASQVQAASRAGMAASGRVALSGLAFLIKLFAIRPTAALYRLFIVDGWFFGGSTSPAGSGNSSKLSLD